MVQTLRPLTVGELLDRTFFYYRGHFVLFVGIAALPGLLTLMLQVATIFFKPAVAGVLLTVALALAAMFVYLVTAMLTHGATVVAVSHILLGRETRIAEAFNSIRPRLGKLIIISLNVAVRVVLGLLLLIVPGILLALRYSLAVPVAVLEDAGVSASLSRSAMLTKGHRGRILLIYFLLFVLMIIASMLWPFLTLLIAAIVSPPAIRIGQQLVWTQVVLQFGNFVSTSLLGPIVTIALTLVYYDERVRKEAFDLEHMMQQLDAAVPPHAAHGMTRTGTRAPAQAVLCLVAVVAASATAEAAADPPVPVPEYIARLDALASAVSADPDSASGATALVGTLPDLFLVDGSTRIFEIPTRSIQRDFRAWHTHRDAAARRRLLNHLRTLRSEAARFEEPAAESSAQRALLTGILAGKEFQDIHGPTWVDRLRQRAFMLLVRLLGRLFQGSAIPTIKSVLVYALMAVAFVALALAAYRLMHWKAAPRTILPGPPIASPKDWPLWLTDAHAAAARGSWRDAIHFTYWCAVAFLEAKGAWRPDRARTPREYLRLLPSSSDDGATLAALTRRFELVWYGNGDADAQAFDESIAYLKKMGCPAA